MAYQKGQSGNPKGRPPEHFRSTAIRKTIHKAAPEIVAGLLAAARNGDTYAGRALLHCVCPPIKPVELPVILPLADDASLSDQGRAVVAALARGIIPPGQAGVLLSGIASLAKLVESDELERRIAALESKRLNP